MELRVISEKFLAFENEIKSLELENELLDCTKFSIKYEANLQRMYSIRSEIESLVAKLRQKKSKSHLNLVT